MDCSPATEVESETETASNPRPTGSEPETDEGAVGGSEAAAAQPKPVPEPRLIPPDLVICWLFKICQINTTTFYNAGDCLSLKK